MSLARVRLPVLQAFSTLDSIKILAAKVHRRCQSGNEPQSPKPPLSPLGPGYGNVPLAGTTLGAQMSRTSIDGAGPSSREATSVDIAGVPVPSRTPLPVST